MGHRPEFFAVFVLSSLLLPYTVFAADELSPWKPGLPDGKLVAHSTSPDGKWALFEINRYDLGMPTTDIAVAVADTHRTLLVGLLDCENHVAVDLSHQAYLTVLWSPDSAYLALHDSTPKNSVLQIYRLNSTGLKKLIDPDLRHLAADQMHLPEQKIGGSGQVPVAWSKMGDLTVQVRLKVDGVTKQKDFMLHVLPDETVQVLP